MPPFLEQSGRVLPEFRSFSACANASAPCGSVPARQQGMSERKPAVLSTRKRGGGVRRSDRVVCRTTLRDAVHEIAFPAVATARVI